MKKVKQFRYYGLNDTRNCPDVENLKNILETGALFNDYSPITQLGIQAPAGTTFYINDTEAKENPIIIGYSGIYELNLEGIAEIYTLAFDEQSLSAIGNLPSAHLIVDIIYEGE